jgi:hypothetical protein
MFIDRNKIEKKKPLELKEAQLSTQTNTHNALSFPRDQGSEESITVAQ